MKKHVIWVIAILALLIVTACTSNPQNEAPNATPGEEEATTPSIPHDGEIIEMGGGHSSWMIYEDMDHITSFDWVSVFRGEVLDERPEWFNSHGSIVGDPPLGTTAYEIRDMFHSIFTVYRVRVIDVFQGDMQPGDIVEVMQEGGERGGFRFGNREKISIAVGDDLVFFAAFSSEFPALPGGFMNPYQTVYRFSDFYDRVAIESDIEMDISEELESMGPDAYHHLTLPITLGDLIGLTIHNFGEEAALELDWVDTADVQAYLAAQ